MGSQHVQLRRLRGCGFSGSRSFLPPAKFPVRKWQARRKTNYMLSTFQKQNEVEPLTLFLVSVFL